MYYELTDRFIVPGDVSKTWNFFGAAENLPTITPPWLAFKVHTPMPIVLGNDAILDYTIRWMGLPIRWRTRIIEWSPPHQFIDLQIRGPYSLWHHQHTFTAREGGVECRDRVIYRLPAPGPLARLVHATIVRRQLQGIFSFRREAIARHFGKIEPLQPAPEIKTLS